MLIVSPLRRLLRSRVGLTAAAVILTLAASSAGLGFAVEARLSENLNANFRGSYDILVRPANADAVASSTRGLVEPNFLSFSRDGGISLAELAGVRAIPGVELAAPVATLGFLSQDLQSPSLVIQEENIPATTALFDVGIMASTSDGVNRIPLRSWDFAVASEPFDFASLVQDSLAGVNHFYVAGETGDVVAGEDGIRLSVSPPLPAVRGPILAVDPEAEGALVGTGLDGLDIFSTLANRNVDDPRDFDIDLIPSGFPVAQFDAATQQELPAAEARPIIPVLVSSQMYAPLLLTVTITRQLGNFGEIPDAAIPFDLIESLREAAAGPVQRVSQETDVSERLVPYQQLDLSLPWPGSEPSALTGGTVQFAQDGTVYTADRPDYLRSSDTTGEEVPSFRIVPQGPVGSDGLPVTDIGNLPQQGYRLLSPGTPSSPQLQTHSPLIAPIGSFNLAEVEVPSDAVNYVPLGAYSPPESFFLTAGDGVSQRLTPTLNPVGFLDIPPLALTDLAAAVQIKGDAPIDAIRIRVSGVTGFNEESRERLEVVASSLTAMGLRVDVVAGAALRDVQVYVPAYLPPLAGRTEFTDLGWVSQRWTSLGAAVEVGRGFGAADRLLLGLAFSSGLLFGVGQQVAEVAGRASDARLLRALGWRRRSILAWHLNESLIVAGLVSIATLTIMIASRRTFAEAWVGFALAGVIPLATALSTPFAWRRATGKSGSLSPPSWVRLVSVFGVFSHALRALVARPSRTMTIALTVAIAAAASSIGLTLVLRALVDAGPTLLAASVGATLRPLQLLIIAVTAVGAALMAGGLFRADRRTQMREQAILEGSGWLPAERRNVTLVYAFLLGTLAASLGAVLAALGEATLLISSSVAAPLAAAAVAYVVTVAGAAQISRRTVANG